MSESASRVALVAASRDGARLAARLGDALPGASRYVLARYLDDADPGAGVIGGALSAAVPELLARHRAVVFFLPVGAVVRLIAPHLGDKRSDPAVVAVDDGGRFAVSVLSGHAGGANELAERVAEALGATAVVTTAVERRGQVAPELIGLPLGWRLEATRGALLRASRALVHGEAIGLFQDGGEQGWLPPRTPCRHFETLRELVESRIEAAIVVTDRALPNELAEPYVVWRPRELVAGMGCSTGAPADELEALLRAAVAEGGLSCGGLRHLATLDRKLAEPGLRELAGRLELELRGHSAAELAGVAVPNPSEVVRRAVGTPSVAEAAALMGCPGGELLIPKRSTAHATVAIARHRRCGGEGRR